MNKPPAACFFLKRLVGGFDFMISYMILRITDEEDSYASVLDTVELTRMLKGSGVKDVSVEKLERTFQQVFEGRSYEMNASHAVPSYVSKSIKINTKVVGIKISPQDLRCVKEVNCNGKR